MGSISSAANFVNGISSLIKRAPTVIVWLLWLLLHLVATLYHSTLGTIDTVESYFISTGFLEKYKHLHLSKLQTLAVVVESQHAYDTSRVVKLLRWLSHIGVKNISLYDMDGVLKKSKKIILEDLGDARLWQPGSDKNSPNEEQNEGQKQITLEFTSFSDGREGIVKAANYLSTEYLKARDLGGKVQSKFSEESMTKALDAVGHGGREPNLLLVYGPVRCHLGFPAWRLRYTEILHMGPLQSMKYGAIVKALHKFAKVQQNYGT